MSALLEVSDLRVTLATSHGRADALRGVSFALERGGTLGLIGLILGIVGWRRASSGAATNKKVAIAGVILSAIAMVMFGSVVGTAFMKWIPMAPARPGTQSTGIRSMRFIRKTQTKIVSAIGATRSFL